MTERDRDFRRSMASRDKTKRSTRSTTTNNHRDVPLHRRLIQLALHESSVELEDALALELFRNNHMLGA